MSITAVAESKQNRVPKGNPSLRGVTLRCYAYREDSGDWVAECIDLDLIVEARTPDAVVRSLHAAMVGYLKTAEMGDTAGLVPRPSPWTHRLRYRLFCLKATIYFARRNFRIIDCSPNYLPECIA